MTAKISQLSLPAGSSAPKSMVVICVLVIAFNGCLYYAIDKSYVVKRAPMTEKDPTPNRSSMQTSWTTIASPDYAELPTAFKKFGYSGMDLMRPMPEQRSLFNFTLVPWKVQADTTEYLSKNIFERLVNWSMIVVVKSRSDHVKRRQTARQTWGSFTYLNGVFMRCIFVVGKGSDSTKDANLIRENEVHGDLLQIDRKEIYGDVGFKALAGMQWVSQAFPPYWIYTSADDDMLPDLVGLYKNFETLMAANLKLPRTNGSIRNGVFSLDILSSLPICCGFVLGMTEGPMRGSCKWCVDNVTYPLEHYPPFCHGGWYSMPVKLANGIFNVSRHHNYYRMDDVWITGLLRLSYFNYTNFTSYFGRNKTDRSIGIWPVAHRGTRHVPNDDDVMNQWKEMEPNILAAARDYIRL